MCEGLGSKRFSQYKTKRIDKILFEVIKIVTTFECVRGLVPKGLANIRQSVLIVISLSKWTF